MKGKGRGSASVQENKETRISRAYAQIREDILLGKFAPSERLRIEKLREIYGVGASPVREALSQLVASGLVIREDQKGFSVLPISKEDLIELTRTRCWVERWALQESMSEGSADWEEGVIIASHRLERYGREHANKESVVSRRWEELHKEFHMALLAACGLRYVVQFCSEMYDRGTRYRNLARGASERSGRDASAEHQKLAKLVLEGKSEAAVELLCSHYEATRDIVLRCFVETD